MLNFNCFPVVKGFGAGTPASVILNTMSWSRREVVVLPDKHAEPVEPYWQVDAAGNCLGILLLSLALFMF